MNATEETPLHAHLRRSEDVRTCIGDERALATSVMIHTRNVRHFARAVASRGIPHSAIVFGEPNTIATLLRRGVPLFHGNNRAVRREHRFPAVAYYQLDPLHNSIRRFEYCAPLSAFSADNREQRGIRPSW